MKKKSLVGCFHVEILVNFELFNKDTQFDNIFIFFGKFYLGFYLKIIPEQEIIP